jgi:hypothetical protein
MGEALLEQMVTEEVYTLSRLCEEVSEVINRVRVAFDLNPMWDAADRAEIREAEQVVDLEARRLQRGEGDPAAWRRALNTYEAVWMGALRELQRSGQRTPCG